MGFWRGVGSADREQFEEFFESKFEGVVRSLVLVLGDWETARDIAQESFVKALLHWQRIGAYDEPVAWVRKVAVRAALRHRQRAARFETLTRGRTVSEVSPDPDIGVRDELVAALADLSPIAGVRSD